MAGEPKLCTSEWHQIRRAKRADQCPGCGEWNDPEKQFAAVEHLRAGTRYRFHGLPDSSVDHLERIVTIQGISVFGEICYVVAVADFKANDSGNLMGVNLLTAERMIELGIWERINED